MRKVKRIVTGALASALALSLTACGGSKPADTTENTTESAKDVIASATDTAKAGPVDADPSIDFEDGKFDFVKINTNKGGADNSELSIEDFGGSKALKVTNVDGGNMFLGINVSALLGDAVADLATVQFDIGTESSDGNFYSTSGVIYTYTGTDLAETKAGPWSVYIDTANPKTAFAEVSGFVAGSDN